MADGNLFAGAAASTKSEVITTLLARPGIRLERIVSTGQNSPVGFWYDQSEDEWVVVLSGSASIDFEYGDPVSLAPGDYLLIPAHRRHRVAFTHPALPTVWLAIHVEAGDGV
jgi:cupin 2 domain-containing protein